MQDLSSDSFAYSTSLLSNKCMYFCFQWSIGEFNIGLPCDLRFDYVEICFVPESDTFYGHVKLLDRQALYHVHMELQKLGIIMTSPVTAYAICKKTAQNPLLETSTSFQIIANSRGSEHYRCWNKEAIINARFLQMIEDKQNEKYRQTIARKNNAFQAQDESDHANSLNPCTNEQADCMLSVPTSTSDSPAQELSVEEIAHSFLNHDMDW